MALPGISPWKPVIPSVAWVIWLSNSMRWWSFPASRISTIANSIQQKPVQQQSKTLSRARIQEIMANRPDGVQPEEILSSLQKKWYVLEWLSPEKLDTPMQDMPQPEWPTSKPSFLQQIGSSLKKRGSAIAENIKWFEASRAQAVQEEGLLWGIKKSWEVPREAVQVLWDVAGAGWDILWAWMMEIVDMLPRFVKEGAKDVGRALIRQPAVQEWIRQISQWMSKYQAWAQENPETAKTLESVYNIAELATNIKWGKLITKGAGQAAKVAATGVQKTWQWIAEIWAAWLWLTTWTSPDTIKTALKYWYKPEFKAALRGGVDETDVLKQVQEAAGRMKMSNSQLYGKAYDKIAKSTATIDPTWAAQPVFDLLQSPTGYAVKANIDDAWRIVLDFSASKIWKNSPQQKIIQDIVDEIQDWKDTSPLGMDILRKRIDDYYVGTPDYAKSDAIVTNLRKEIWDRIVKEVPEYAEMNAKYSEVSSLLNDIKWALSLGNKAQTSTAITKLKWALKRNQEFRQAMIKELQTYADTDILATLAWTELSQWMPRWLAWVAAWVAWYMNPQLLAWLAASSPRIIGELAVAIWTSKKLVWDAVKKAAWVVKKAAKNNPLSWTPLNDIPFDLSTAASSYSNSVKE